MKKIIFVLAVAATLLQSCSTGSMFSKKRYGHLNWIDHDTKVETPVTTEEKKTKNTTDKNHAPEAVISMEKEQVTTVNNPAVSAPVMEENTTPAPAVVSKTDMVETTPEAEATIQSNREFGNMAKEVMNDVVSSVKSAKEGSLGELLVMAILIALAIVLFLILDTALRGLLSLILIILVILILLRYLGVI